MKFEKLQFGGVVALALLAGLATEPALAQRGIGQGKKAQREARRELKQQEKAAQGVRPGSQFVPGKGPRAGMPPRWLDRLRQMTPEEQERFLKNNERFKKLPAERQEQIRQNLRRWNGMTPEQQQEMRRREAVLESMSPEERRRVREEILPKWQQMEPARRQALLRRLRELRGMTDEEREARLKDEAFLQGLGPEDRVMLRELARLRLGPGAPQEPPPDNPPPA